jgi:hypothetical protein
MSHRLQDIAALQRRGNLRSQQNNPVLYQMDLLWINLTYDIMMKANRITGLS